MSRIKGVVLDGIWSFVEERFGEEGVEKVKSGLGESRSAIFPLNVREEEFYNLGDYTLLNLTLDTELGDGSGRLIEESACHTVNYSIFDVYADYLGRRLNTVEDFINALPKILLLFYENIETRIERTGFNDYRVSSKVPGFNDPDYLRVTRLRTEGWLREMVRRFKVKEAKVSTEENVAEGALVSRITWN